MYKDEDEANWPLLNDKEDDNTDKIQLLGDGGQFRNSQEYKDKYKELGEAMSVVIQMLVDEENFPSLITESKALENISIAAYRAMKLIEKEMIV